MNKLLVASLVFLACGVSYANCGNDNGRGNGCSGGDSVVGPQGPQGPAGTDGIDGVDGTNGIDGANGKDGSNGRDGDTALDATRTSIGAEIRWYDAKHISITSGYRYDINHGGHTIDMAVLHIKVGKSYEERIIDKLKMELDILKSAAHMPGKHQHRIFEID